MIPEFAGATPYGIFLLAHDYLSAAGIVVREFNGPLWCEGTPLLPGDPVECHQGPRNERARFRKAITGLARYHRTIQSEV